MVNNDYKIADIAIGSCKRYSPFVVEHYLINSSGILPW